MPRRPRLTFQPALRRRSAEVPSPGKEGRKEGRKGGREGGTADVLKCAVESVQRPVATGPGTLEP